MEICIIFFSLNLAIGILHVLKLPIDMAGDTSQNIEIANALVGKANGNLYYYRSWGYPIFLIISGYPWHKNIYIPIFLQLILASSIPCLISSALARLNTSKPIWISAGILTTLSFSPIVLAHSVLSDTVNQFFLYLLVWTTCCALSKINETKKTRTELTPCIFISLIFFILALLRPANLLMPVFSLSVTFFSCQSIDKNHKKFFFDIIIITFTIFLTWSVLQKIYTNFIEKSIAREFTEKSGSLSGAMFFWNIYSSGSTFVDSPIIRSENGPCTKQLYLSVNNKLHLFAPSGLSSRIIFRNPSLLNHYYRCDLQ